MKRLLLGPLLLVGGLAAFPPESVDAQVTFQVHVYWEEGGREGWRPYRSDYGPPRARYGRAVRVPPGHLPPTGYCRLWYPGRPPGHQPPAQRCGHLSRTAHSYPGAVIVGAHVVPTLVAYSERAKRPRKRGKRRW